MEKPFKHLGKHKQVFSENKWNGMELKSSSVKFYSLMFGELFKEMGVIKFLQNLIYLKPPNIKGFQIPQPRDKRNNPIFIKKN